MVNIRQMLVDIRVVLINTNIRDISTPEFTDDGNVAYVNKVNDSLQITQLLPSDNDIESQVGYLPGTMDSDAEAALGS